MPPKKSRRGCNLADARTAKANQGNDESDDGGDEDYLEPQEPAPGSGVRAARAMRASARQRWAGALLQQIR